MIEKSDLLGSKEIHKITANIVGYIYEATRELDLVARMTVMEYLNEIVDEEARESRKEVTEYNEEEE